jgi:hypothetical protein
VQGLRDYDSKGLMGLRNSPSLESTRAIISAPISGKVRWTPIVGQFPGKNKVVDVLRLFVVLFLPFEII